MNRRIGIAVIASACVATAATAAPVFAHTGHSTSGLWSGLTHPLLGIDHIFAMVTVGVLASVLRRPIAVPAAFLAAMIAGGALGILGMPLPAGEFAIALSVVALGGALLAGQSMRADVALGLVGLAGFVHGHAHGVEAPTAAHPVIYVAGFVVATAALHITGVLVGTGVRTRPTLRTSMGAAVIGAGIGFMAGVL